MPTDPTISARAKAIANGLIRTGRASEGRAARGHLRLRAERTGSFYWITADGSRLLRGDELDSAEELQASFVQAMVQAGEAR
jgi:hypothetical protein